MLSATDACRNIEEMHAEILANIARQQIPKIIAKGRGIKPTINTVEE